MPGLLQWRKRRFDRNFETGHGAGSCRGCYASYAQAAAAAPTSLPLGFDHAAAAAMYRDRLNHIYPSDYPMMLWLQKAFGDGARTVFDLGGHVGIAYYAYQHVLAFPSHISP